MKKEYSNPEVKDLESVKKEFELWRKTRKGKRTIPERLWVLASTLKDRYTNVQISRCLRLNNTDLKKKIKEIELNKTPDTENNSFLEFKLKNPIEEFSTKPICIAELKSPSGISMKIYSSKENPIGLLELSKIFFENAQ
ncbi:hypothetical protein KAJ27_09330 [bacterium]|nr:hypothetical protein [Candidatus Neomarinimicrobiota bacterium]MCK5684314.1 hypothetical protein [bacterium]